jgi:NADPH:quinone reductase-like Zn-dependent oxidoreductase
MPSTMRAVVLDAPGPPSALEIRELPIPVPSAGWVLIRVRAFGLNRLELYLQLGLSEGVSFPRVPGVEATGVVEQCPGGEFQAGQRIGYRLDVEPGQDLARFGLGLLTGRSGARRQPAPRPHFADGHAEHGYRLARSAGDPRS